MMAAITSPGQLTQDDFMRLQREGAGYEYECGRLIPLSPVEGQQSSAWGEFYLALGNYVKQNRCGRVWLDLLTYLDPQGTIRYFPDLVYLANDRLSRFDGRKIVGAPTLVVEVTTPDSDEREEGDKKVAYFAAGVPWYWAVNTVTRNTKEYRREEAGYVLVSETPLDAPFRPALFPGLEIVAVPSEP